MRYVESSNGSARRYRVFPVNRLLGATAVLAWATLGLQSCHKSEPPDVGVATAPLGLSSTSVRDGRIPARFTCDGANISPALSWATPPAATKSFALILDDPDLRPAFAHWVLYNLPASSRSLPEGVPPGEALADGARQGQNDFGKVGYGGPCPPDQSTHHYAFRLYALDSRLELPEGATKQQVVDAFKGHIVAHGRLTASYSR
jgi:Raf kinase inhibitor-like YbhB/YbcL family protein